VDRGFEVAVVDGQIGQFDSHTDAQDLVNGLGSIAASVDGLALLASVLNALPVAVYMTDAYGAITFYNNGAAALWGDEPEIGMAMWCGFARLFWPDGVPMAHDKSALAMALKERRIVRGIEALGERPDGSRIRFLAYPAPLFSGPDLAGAVNMLVEIGERDRLGYFEQRLAAIVECSEDAIISKDLNGIITTWNRAAERLFGYTAEEAVGRPVTMLIPMDRQNEEAAILGQIRRGKPVARYETLRQRKDGSLVPIALTVSPLRDGTGRIVGASKIARDISDQVRMREHQTLLLREMSHRVKNVLAVAGGLVGLSARSAQSPKAMARAVQERLGAYSRAHDLTRSGVRGRGDGRTTLQVLLNAIVQPYLDGSGEKANVSVEGDDVEIDADATASLALLFHEFMTNAAKHGALSAPGGTVRIVCRCCGRDTEIQWIERGGPRLSGAPRHQGFGSVLAARTVEGALGGTLHSDWQCDGVVISMTLPSPP